MKTESFNKNFTIDTKTKRGIKALPKHGGGYPETLTADGTPFNSENKYFFFDESTQKVRDTISLRRVDAEWLGGFGLRIVKIENLRSNKPDALSDGQGFFKKQIESLNEAIQNFETEKASGASENV